MELETARLILKPLSSTHFQNFYEMCINPFVRKFLFDDVILTSEDVKKILATSNRSFQSNQYGLWLIILKSNSVIIGFTGLWHFFDEERPQLLYALLPEYTGQGYAVEAAKEIINYTFKQLEFAELIASCDHPNLASHKVAIAAGMKKLMEVEKEGKQLTYYVVSPAQEKLIK